MKIVLYGTPLGAGGYLTEIPYLLNNKIERIYKDACDLHDLEADIAIANFTRFPSPEHNDPGRNWEKLPKVKVQLAIQAEHWDEYIPEWVPGITYNFDGSICYPFNAPFFEFDDSKHDCFSKSYWEEHNIPIKPVFYFDPMVKWNKFYNGPLNNFKDYGFMIGSSTIHRERIRKSNPYKFRYLFGDMRDPIAQQKLKHSGIAWNVHKFQLKGKCPETDGKEIKYVPKTESIKLSFFYNLGMAVISEKLDYTFPERFHIIETDNIENFEIDPEQLKNQAELNEQTLESYHDLDTEQDILINSIKEKFGLKG